MVQMGGLQFRARIGKHIEIDIDPDRPFGAPGEQLDDTARSCAQIDEQTEWPRTERFEHRLLDLLFGNVQPANDVPLARMGLEVALRRLRALFQHRIGPHPVAFKDWIAEIQRVHDRPRQRT